MISQNKYSINIRDYRKLYLIIYLLSPWQFLKLSIIHLDKRKRPVIFTGPWAFSTAFHSPEGLLLEILFRRQAGFVWYMFSVRFFTLNMLQVQYLLINNQKNGVQDW